jgi:hypothetical protein
MTILVLEKIQALICSWLRCWLSGWPIHIWFQSLSMSCWK